MDAPEAADGQAVLITTSTIRTPPPSGIFESAAYHEFQSCGGSQISSLKSTPSSTSIWFSSSAGLSGTRTSPLPTQIASLSHLYFSCELVCHAATTICRLPFG